MGATITPLSETTGVEITGLTGPQLVEEAVAQQCREALDRYGVVIYRDTLVEDDDLVAFSRLLGDLVPLAMGDDKRHPEIQVITRDRTRSKLAAYREATFFWHIDGTTDDVPNKSTLLTAHTVSDDGGGDTEFANAYAAYDALSDEQKAELEGVLSLIHI